MEAAVADYCTWLSVHGYAEGTRRLRHYHLATLVAFLHEAGVDDPALVTPAILERYQRHLFTRRRLGGGSLSMRTQSGHLVSLRGLFSHLARTRQLPYDPAATLTLPRTTPRLPEATLSAEEARAVLSVPDTTTPLGLRDRAILEVFYSTAIRRAELAALLCGDVDFARGTLFVRRGKGGYDRHVPIGQSARGWVRRYLDEVRPHYAPTPDRGTLFLSTIGGPLGNNILSRTVTGYVHAAVPTKRGSCHLFRHSTATLMLDAGADVRHVAELLGHRKLETTMTYTRVSVAKLQAVHAACHPAEQGRG